MYHYSRLGLIKTPSFGIKESGHSQLNVSNAALFSNSELLTKCTNVSIISKLQRPPGGGGGYSVHLTVYRAQGVGHFNWFYLGIHARIFPGFWEVTSFSRTEFFGSKWLTQKGTPKVFQGSLIYFCRQNMNSDLLKLKVCPRGEAFEYLG